MATAGLLACVYQASGLPEKMPVTYMVLAVSPPSTCMEKTEKRRLQLRDSSGFSPDSLLITTPTSHPRNIAPLAARRGSEPIAGAKLRRNFLSTKFLNRKFRLHSKKAPTIVRPVGLKRAEMIQVSQVDNASG